jgi:heme/copper-type cytochrome/quinol oxidase subunit 4
VGSIFSYVIGLVASITLLALPALLFTYNVW